jgi:DNA-binding NarL/FixJ family response regulator
MAKTQLLLLDDHTLFRAMLSRLLDTESDFRVVAHCPPVRKRSMRWATISSI